MGGWRRELYLTKRKNLDEDWIGLVGRRNLYLTKRKNLGWENFW